MAYQAARTTRSKTQYKTVGTPYGATKRLKKHSASGTARKRTLKRKRILFFAVE